MAMNYCIGLGVAMMMLGFLGSYTGGHDHVVWMFGINLVHNILHLSLGFVALAAVAAGPRHTRMFCLEVGVFLPMIAALGFLRFALIEDVLNVQPVDLWLYAIAGTGCLVLGLASHVPLRLREAVERAPITWA
jgi:hypothetical protein